MQIKKYVLAFWSLTIFDLARRIFIRMENHSYINLFRKLIV